MTTMGCFDWLQIPAAQPAEQMRSAAVAHQSQLTKPAGALGRLEEVAIQLAALQGTKTPAVNQVHICIFAADHGVAVEGISAFPQAVTAEMIKNFAAGGAAICVIARSLNAELEIINLGTVADTGDLPVVKHYGLGPGTANFSCEAAMTEQQLSRALAAGRHAAERAKLAGAQLFVAGEMGIGNTSSATALVCALLDLPPERIAGPGTGLDASGVQRKVQVIQRGLDLHRDFLHLPVQVLQRLGGFEIAALAGSYIACAHIGLPVVVDGFIATSAALVATRLCPGVEQWFLFSHASAEPGHRRVLEALQTRPLLDLDMRLGEGSGAAVVVPLLRMACALHNEMATFSQASVSGKL